MDTTVFVVLIALSGVIIGILLTILYRMLMNHRRSGLALDKASEILKSAEEEKRLMVLNAQEEVISIRSEMENELKSRRLDLQRSEQRLSNKEDNVDRRSSNLDSRDKEISRRAEEISSVEVQIKDIDQKALNDLEKLSGLSVTEATDEIMARTEEMIQHDLAVRYKEIEDRISEESNDKAIEMVSSAIQRLASDVVSEQTLTTVPLPNDEMKGRLIGREGRNIRAIEKATGVDLIIDDTPESVTLSCFDPVRKEVARLSIGKLVLDGRIQPARIEEVVFKTEKDLMENIRKMGQDTILDLGLRGINRELTRLMGSLNYRYSYGQNVLKHSIEVAYLASTLAHEIGADPSVSMMGGFLHDLGKSLSHEIQGPHAQIGADIALKNRIGQTVCACIREHHDDEHSTAESFLVAAADAISAARPGSRKDTVENYVQRMEALEAIGSGFDGVEKCFAVQAGREIRVMVEPEKIDDAEAAVLANEIVKEIEEKLAYPGQIKVTVVREKRSVEIAR